jgi:chromosomal replication initiator protein
MEIPTQHRFDTFAEGESSSLAFAAANALANGNCSLGNPLVLVGGTGLGKSHLLHSIANAFKAKNQEQKIICTNALEFSKEYVDNIQQKKENPGQIDEMAAKFRNADMLLLDDLQNIEGKTSSQHELLQIFNTLLLAGKPIIVASQIPVSDMENLNESLRSRLTGGLTAVISLPGLVDRLAILRKKFDMLRLNIDENILQFLAENTSGTARDLEGIASTLSFWVSQSNKDVSLEMANKILAEHFSNSQRVIPVESIVKAISSHYGVSIEILKQKGRGSKETAFARQVAMYLIRSKLKKSFNYIGKYFNRDNSTAVYSCKAIEEKIQREISFRLEIEKIKKSLYE